MTQQPTDPPDDDPDGAPRDAATTGVDPGGGADPVEPADGVRPVDLRDYVRFDEGAATRVRVFATDVLTVDLWCVEPHQATRVLRYDDVDVAYTVIGGRAWFVTEAGEVGLDPLGALLVPAGTAHGIDNRAVDPLVVLASASPPDEPVTDLGEDDPVADAREAIRDDKPSVTNRLLRGLRRDGGG